MFALRCTKKLLARGAQATIAPDISTTTLLGDWYANVTHTRPEHLVLCVSERTLLPVVVKAKDVKALPSRVAAAVKSILLAIGVPPNQVIEEFEHMQSGHLSTTASRKVLGSLNDMMFHFECQYGEHPELALQDHALRLASIPFKATDYAYPQEATRALFASAAVIRSAKSAA